LGKGIHIFHKLEDNPNDYIITKYVSNPHLINEFKYDFRLYVLITGLSPLKMYLYKDGLVRFTTEKYSLDLNKIDAYKNAWEDLSSDIAFTVKTSQKSSFQNMMKTVKTFGSTVYSESDLYEAGLSTNPASSYYYGNYGIVHEGNYYYDYGYNSFGTFDVKDFLNKLETNYSALSGKITPVRTAYEDLLVHNTVGKQAGESNGLCLFFPMSDRCKPETYYSVRETSLASWKTVTLSLGEK
jgi:hypothetical protein